jgi:hypothetical protein
MVSSCACRNGSFDGATIGTPWTEWMPASEKQKKIRRKFMEISGFGGVGVVLRRMGPACQNFRRVVRVSVLQRHFNIFGHQRHGFGGSGTNGGGGFRGGGKNIWVRSTHPITKNKGRVGSAIAPKTR